MGSVLEDLCYWNPLKSLTQWGGWGGWGGMKTNKLLSATELIKFLGHFLF